MEHHEVASIKLFNFVHPDLFFNDCYQYFLDPFDA
jgi:hypothetical protein